MMVRIIQRGFCRPGGLCRHGLADRPQMLRRHGYRADFFQSKVICDRDRLNPRNNCPSVARCRGGAKDDESALPFGREHPRLQGGNRRADTQRLDPACHFWQKCLHIGKRHGGDRIFAGPDPHRLASGGWFVVCRRGGVGRRRVDDLGHDLIVLPRGIDRRGVRLGKVSRVRVRLFGRLYRLARHWQCAPLHRPGMAYGGPGELLPCLSQEIIDQLRV